MAGPLQIEGAQSAPSDYAPLHVNRMVTGFWTNTNPLRDAATEMFTEKFYGGRQDRIAAGKNAEISSRLTLRRRPGLSVYNTQTFPAIVRFYGWNTFTTTSEHVRVMADTVPAVYDATGPNTRILIWSKPFGSGPSFFLGVGNILYFTNALDNKQLDNATGIVSDWGVKAPVNAPTVTQTARPNPYPTWQPDTCYSTNDVFGLAIEDSNFNIERVTTFGVTGAMEPSPWNPTIFLSTPDNTVMWQNMGPSGWTAGHNYVYGDPIVGRVLDPISGLLIGQLFWCIHAGTSGSTEPAWLQGAGALINDNGVIWKNAGNLLYWASDIGASCPIVGTATILDPNGYLQTIAQAGKSGSFPPDWQTEPGAYTTDGGITWVNSGNFASGTTAPWLYGYAYKNATGDIGNMSPPSAPISVAKGGEVIMQGDYSTAPQNQTVVLYRTTQGGSTYFLLDEIPNVTSGGLWTYTDTHADADLTVEIQAQVAGEGTPLPQGASCMEYHVGRIFAAVGNVVYVSTGPDAIVSGSSGNAGFNTTFTAQSKITRFWVNSLGVVVFTVRDVYIILGSGTASDPLYMVKYIENLPLLNYDAFAIYLTTPYMLTGHKMVNALDPSAGIIEASFPIADQIAAIDPKYAYVTFHSGPSGETALYVADGQTLWYRMAPTSAPESGLNWNPPAFPIHGTSAVQSVETTPGTMTLLIGPSDALGSGTTGQILMRDTTVSTDDGAMFDAYADIGNIVLAHTGQLAGLAWIALESEAVGTATKVSVMLDETKEITGSQSAKFSPVPRTRQDPPNSPPSETIYSNRHSLLQDQKPVWCKSLKMRLEWPAEDAANELDTYAIFGQVWAEQRSQ
jgi:hypothetical protein